MTRTFRHGTALLKIGLVIAVITISIPAWRAELQAGWFGWFGHEAEVHCEVGNPNINWWYILWTEEIPVKNGDVERCDHEISFWENMCTRELQTYEDAKFVIDVGCAEEH
jgi:hypothetical protein